MSCFAILDAGGKHVATVDDPGGVDVPEGGRVVELKRRPDWCEKIEGGAIVLNVDRIDRKLCADIDAGVVGALAVVRTPGKEAIYAEKQRQAQRLFAGDEGPFPAIEREAKRTGATLEEAAAAIVRRAEEVRRIEAAIDEAQLSAKAKVRSLKSRAGKEKAAAVDWGAVVSAS